MFSVGIAALYCGLVRPEVSTTPKRLREYLEQDPADRPPVRLPPFVVAETPLSDGSGVAGKSGSEAGP